MNKQLLKKLVIEYGKLDTEHNAYAWREISENPFNTLLLAALGYGGKGDTHTFKAFYELKDRAKNTTLAEFLEKLCKENRLEEIVKELKYPENFAKTLSDLIEFNRKYRLDRRKDLSYINPDELYSELKNIYGFRTESGVILPWAVCDLIRLWRMRVPKNLKLSVRAVEKLKEFDLSPDDFDVEDYPYVDLAMFRL